MTSEIDEMREMRDQRDRQVARTLATWSIVCAAISCAINVIWLVFA